MIAFEGNGVITEFGGGYDDWQRFTQQRQQEGRAEDKRIADLAQSNKAKQAPSTPAKITTKLSFKEQKELDEIPAQIDQLEAEQNDINTQLADNDIYKAQADKVKTLQARLATIETLLENLLARWEILDAKKV